MLPTHNKWRSLSFGHIFRSNCLFNGTEREYHYFVSLTLTQEVSSWLMICGESKLFRSWIKIQHLAEGCLWLRSILGTLSRLFVYSELWRICIILYFCLLSCMHWSPSLTGLHWTLLLTNTLVTMNTIWSTLYCLIGSGSGAVLAVSNWSLSHSM